MKKVVFLLALSIALLFIYVGDAQTEECMLCHRNDIGGVYPAINETLFGSHKDVNTTDGAGIISNSDCTVCHYNTSNMLYPGFTVSTYTCEDCHIKGVVSSPRVNNHTRNANLSVSAYCYDCHNKTSTLFKYSANASAAHYGINASFGIPPGNQYCAYCHQNSTTAYSNVMQNPSNSIIRNHTSDIVSIFPLHPSALPNCISCHGQDKLHGTNISKPVPSSDFCNSCHINDRLKKDRHDGKVECIRCHAELPSDIHNIKYILPDGSYRGINATLCGDCHDFSLQPPYFKLPFLAANCTTCHQRSGLAKFSEAPLIPTPMNHSANPYSGALWNGSQQAYWDNATQQSSCNYCHRNTTHAPKALGKIENIRSGNMPNQSITSTSYWCANCHYNGSSSSGNYSYNATAFSPLPPEIQNKTGTPDKASDNTPFFNHSLKEWSDRDCVQCHSVNSPSTTALFVHNLAPGGGGADCASCHDVIASGAPADKRINISIFNKSIHYTLNKGGNSACWACHGNGTEPAGHPPEYKTPRKCSSDSCHSLNQEFQAPAVYSHFRNASLNSNPNNVVNFNVTTSSNCENCHINNALAQGKNQNSTASHYASRELIDSINCIYCHMNKDNSEKWGNATLINKNRTQLVELDRERNKFQVKAGELADLGFLFRLKVLEVSSLRGNALIELFKDNMLVDRSLVGMGNYTYEEELTIDNSSARLPMLVLNITGIFKGDNISFIQFEGFRLKRLHAENKTTSCYLCHVYTKSRVKYRVIERVDKDKDEIFYTEEPVNFTDKKEHNENSTLLVIANLTDNDGYVSIKQERRRALFEGEAWNISENYSILLKEVNIKSDEVFLILRVGNYSYEDIVKKGEVFEFKPSINYLGYQPKNITIFRARVSEIIQAKRNMAVLEEVAALSPDIKKIKENASIEGYNASWLWENSTFTVGKIPENFHSPQIYDGRDGGGDCLSCHGTEGFLEKRYLFRWSEIPGTDSDRLIDFLRQKFGVTWVRTEDIKKSADSVTINISDGKNHILLRINNEKTRATLSINGAEKDDLIADTEKDKLNIYEKRIRLLGRHEALRGNNACYACHGGNERIKTHPTTYKTPRDCVSCHASLKDNYSAVYIGDEEHKNEKCETCHVADIHNVFVFRLGLPAVTNVSLLKQENKTIVKAFAVAGYKMKVRDARYYIDSPEEKFKISPLDGAFDSQREEIFAEIDVSNLSKGKHVVYVEAMERNNKWGAPASIVFTIESTDMKGDKKLSLGVVPLFGIFAAFLVRKYVILFRQSKVC